MAHMTSVVPFPLLTTIFLFNLLNFPLLASAISSCNDDTCESSGNLNCDGESYPQYKCSPLVLSSTEALLTLNDFSDGGDGGAPSECDEEFHESSERVVALSTGWYDGGSRCGRMIRITATNGKSTTAKVVDECDSVNGCDEEHAGLPPCRNNIVDGSQAVWEALGLDGDVGEESVTWSMLAELSSIQQECAFIA